MTDEPENIVLQMLRRLDGKLDRVIADGGDLKVRVSSLEIAIGQLEVAIGRINQRIDRIEQRLDRIQWRLDLMEP